MEEIMALIPGADACLGVDREGVFAGGFRIIVFEVVDHLLYAHCIGRHLLAEVDEAPDV